MNGNETVRDKARRYLGDGRLTLRLVTHDHTVAFVRGDSGELHRAEWDRATGWSCSYPTRTRRCSHLLALRPRHRRRTTSQRSRRPGRDPQGPDPSPGGQTGPVRTAHARTVRRDT